MKKLDNPVRKFTSEEITKHLGSGYPITAEEMIANRSPLAEAGYYPDVCVPIAESFTLRVKTWANNLSHMVTAFRDIPVETKIVAELRILSRALAYLVNSASFRDKKYHEFDKIEIDRKVGRK